MKPNFHHKKENPHCAKLVLFVQYHKCLKVITVLKSDNLSFSNFFVPSCDLRKKKQKLHSKSSTIFKVKIWFLD